MSRIEWTETTWNPIAGCSAVSEGCRNCYAAAMTKRLASMEKRQYMDLINRAGHFNGRIRLLDERLTEPLRWKKPRRVFVNSMSDLFHERVPDEFIGKVYEVMSCCPRHTFQVLTKRPERMAAFHERYSAPGGPLPVIPDNIWLGTSVENQEAADERIPHLLRCPVAVRFLSCEPLLGELNLTGDGTEYLPDEYCSPSDPPPRIDWVVVGGESGPGARDCCVDEIESIISQCRAAGVPCFVKQLGARPILGDLSHPHGWPTSHMPVNWETGRIQLRHPKGGDPAEWPEDLRVREYPKTNPAASAGNTQET